MNSYCHLLFLLAIALSQQTYGLTLASLNNVAPAYYIPITLTNSQASATSANLQVKITINSNSNSSIYASNLANVNWQDGSGQILNSWLESGETNTSTSSVYWINLGSRTIAASGGTLTIYQVVYSTNSNLMNGTNTGAEPHYTGTYAQYDNGATIFPVYTNWSGTSLPAGWTVSSGTNYTVSNGVTLGKATGGTQFAILYGTIQTTAIIAEANVTADSVTGGTPSAGIFVTRTNTFGLFMYDQGYGAGAQGSMASSKNILLSDASGNAGSVTSGAGFTLPSVVGVLWQTTGNITGYWNYSTTLASTDVTSSFGNYYISLMDSGAAQQHYTTYSWTRTRQVPPNAVLPSVGIGSLVNFRSKGFLPQY